MLDPQPTDADDDKLRLPERLAQLKEVGGRCALAGCPTAHRARSVPTQQLVIRFALNVSDLPISVRQVNAAKPVEP